MKYILLLALCLTTALHAQQPDAAPTPHTFSSNDGRKLTATIIEKTATTICSGPSKANKSRENDPPLPRK